jgi:hypothetical protein
MNNRGLIPGRGKFFFPLFATAMSRPALGSARPPIQRVLTSLSPGVKQSGREDDNSSPFSTKVKNACICTFILPIRLHDVVLS